MEALVNAKSVRFNGRPINLRRLSEDSGISLSHVSRILSGKRDPSLSVLIRLGGALGMTPDEFLAARGDYDTNT